jgi:hypothetical protein
MPQSGPGCPCEAKFGVKDCWWCGESISSIAVAQSIAVSKVRPLPFGGRYGSNIAFLGPDLLKYTTSDTAHWPQVLLWNQISYMLLLMVWGILFSAAVTQMWVWAVSADVRYFFCSDFKIIISKFWSCQFFAGNLRFLKTLSASLEIKNSFSYDLLSPSDTIGHIGHNRAQIFLRVNWL